MATFRKRGETWRAEVRLRGLYRSRTFETKRDARQWAAEVEAEIAEPALVGGAKPVREALLRYRREVSVRKKGRRWEEVRLDRLALDRIADVPIGRLSASDIADWRDRRLREVAAASVNRELNLLSSVFERARKEWGWLAANPVRDVSRPRNPRHRDRRISASEIKRVLITLGYDEVGEIKTAQQQVGLAFLLALETAMRLGEMLALEPRDLHLDQRYLTIRDSKNDDRRDVPLTQRAVELLRRLPEDRLFSTSRDQASVLFGRAVRKAGIDDLRFHDSRHEAITRLARKLDVLDLARMIGHRDLRSLRTYYNATAQEIAQRLD